jgi:Bor protein
MVSVSLAAVACVCTLGCGANTPIAQAPHQHWVPGYAFGLYGKADLDVRDDCPSTGPANIRVGTTWSTFLVSVATLGVYTPREVAVRCKAR